VKRNIKYKDHLRKTLYEMAGQNELSGFLTTYVGRALDPEGPDSNRLIVLKNRYTGLMNRIGTGTTGVVGKIANMYEDTDPKPLIVYADDGDATINEVESIAGELIRLRADIAADESRINTAISAKRTELDGDDSAVNRFDERIDRYNELVDHNRAATEQYTHQKSTHVAALATNVAIFAGTIAVLYAGLHRGGKL
jgi:hypothetical protein